MSARIDRREFLKLAGMAPLAYLSYKAAESIRLPRQGEGQAKNVLIILFDSWTAANVSLYGYRRETMPNLARLAEKAVVYHQHHSGGNYTTPGTASLLTGTYPWTHRAYRFDSGVAPALAHHNIFDHFADYHRIAYSHNPLPNTFFKQWDAALEQFIHSGDLFLNHDLFLDTLFPNDHFAAGTGKQLAWFTEGTNRATSSLFLARAFGKLVRTNERKLLGEYHDQFPIGLPTIGEQLYFLLEDAVDWLTDELPRLPAPFLGYFHFWPPHSPYRPRKEFYGRFHDDLGFLSKPEHALTMRRSADILDVRRTVFDEYIAYVDAEFARLYQGLEQSGLLENTILVLTADHGEMFERGISGHFHPAMHQPVIHIPLLIFLPGLQERVNILTPTSAVDVLPTLAHLTGHPHPAWTEGQVLRPFRAGPVDAQRPVYSVEAKDNPPDAPLDLASFSYVRWPYKMTLYKGYSRLKTIDRQLFELYDIETDPEELVDLYHIYTDVAAEMRAELEAKLAEVNAPYLRES